MFGLFEKKERCQVCQGKLKKYRYNSPNKHYSSVDLSFCLKSKEWSWYCDNPSCIGNNGFHTPIRPYTGTMILCPYCGQDT